MYTTTGILLMVIGFSKGDFWHSLDVNETGAANTTNPDVMCDFPSLSKQQRKLCTRHNDHMQYILEGSHNAVVECKRLFENDRWNCPTEPDSLRTGSAFSRLIGKGFRESALVQAITSAGIVHSLARACRRGNMENCRCASSEDSPREDIETAEDRRWCRYIDYASKFAEKFTDEKTRNRKKLSTKQQMELHNRRTGRLAVKNVAKVNCKCHGLKGSCNLKTCWIELGSFRDVGRNLKNAYENAVKVRVKRGKIITNRTEFDENDLVFLNYSPNFCESDEELQTQGTRDRPCLRDDLGPSGCELMCCGRGYTTKRVEVVEYCKCQFQWCCRIQCYNCYRSVNRDVCL